MREFPHLKDTRFPNLDTVDVYRFQNTFDYTRWNEDTRIRLVNVIWNSDYSDVVKFDTDSERDSYFDNIEDFYAVELAQAARIVPDNYIKLPIPYDVMARYNYLFVDMPIATSQEAPIDYERGYGIRRWYFFIDDIAYLSPNSTQCFLSLDVWTNFQNSVEINYLMLERGHAPVAASDTDAYLENPIANNRYLLAPDVNFDNADVVRSADYVPFGNGTKYVCIASTCSLEQIAELGTVTSSADFDPFDASDLVYTDVQARYGHQLDVTGYSMGIGRDFSDARTPATPAQTNSRTVANNLMIYAIPAAECYVNGTFFDDVMEECPQFMNTIQACFVVDERCIEFQYPCVIAGHDLWTVIGSRLNLLTKQLTQNDFDFPTELRRFAKLYTSPYSKLEVTDNDGTTFEVNIEETSTLSLKSVVSIAFPYIDYKIYLDGVGASGYASYYWVDLAGHQEQMQMSNADWFKYCFDWSIPTFALYMDGETAYQLANFNRAVDMGIQNALVGYHNAMRSANTGMENARDSADTTLLNVQASTETAKTNAYNSAETAKTNADNNAETAETNAKRGATAAKSNADASADAADANTNNMCDASEDNRGTKYEFDNQSINDAAEFNIWSADRSTAVSEGLWWLDMEMSARVLGLEIDAMTSTITNGAVQNIGHGVVNGTTTGFSMGGPHGAIAGLAIGAGLAGMDSVVSAQQAAVVWSKEGAIWDGQAEIGNQKWEITRELNMEMAEQQNDLRLKQFGNDHSSGTLQLARTNQAIRENAGRSRDVAKANAERSRVAAFANAEDARDTAETNADNTRDTSETNADNNYATDRANAQRSRDRIYSNSGFTREVEELNAKEILENSARNGMARILDARNAAPSKIGITGGDPSADAMRTRGVQLKVKTQSDSAIRQTGDTFARFGYALNQVWNVRETGLKLMRNFTYWKASDIWVDDRQSSNNIVQAIITKIFMQGVTVWGDPEKIGRISVYDN